MQFVCLLSCLRPYFVVQINNIFRLVLFAAITHKRRGEKQISKTIKYKLDSSSKMQFVFFYPKNIQKYFLENYQFYRKCGNDAKSRGVGGGSCSCIIMTHCVRKSTYDAPLIHKKVKKPEKRHWRSSVFIVNFKHISHLFLVFLLLTLTSKC